MPNQKSFPPGYPSGGIRITGYTDTTAITDQYPTHLDVLGKGGYHTVGTIAERDNITVQRRSEGMFCYVADSDGLGNPNLYYLASDLVTWVQVNLLNIKGSDVTLDTTSFWKHLKEPVLSDDVQKMAEVVDNLDTNSMWQDIPGHTFKVGDIVHNGNGVLELAIADKTSDKLAHGIIADVNGNKVKVGGTGFYLWPAHGLTVGNTYYTSVSVPGALESTPPASSGTYTQACVFVMSSQSILFQNTTAVDNDLTLELEE